MGNISCFRDNWILCNRSSRWQLRDLPTTEIWNPAKESPVAVDRIKASSLTMVTCIWPQKSYRVDKDQNVSADFGLNATHYAQSTALVVMLSFIKEKSGALTIPHSRYRKNAFQSVASFVGFTADDVCCQSKTSLYDGWLPYISDCFTFA